MPDGRKPRKILPMLGFALMSLVLGTGAGLFATGRIRLAPAAPAAKQQPAAESHKPEAPETVYSLGEMVVNLADTDQMRYAKISVAIGIREKLTEEQLKPFEPALKDTVVRLASSRTFVGLHRPDGIEGLKRDLRAALQGRTGDNHLVEVYVEGFTMQ